MEIDSNSQRKLNSEISLIDYHSFSLTNFN